MAPIASWGLPPIDWSGEELSKKKKGKEATKDAKAKKDTVRRSGTAPAHKLDEYAGDYEHPGYGIIQVELHDGQLNLTYNKISAPLEHWHYEVFNALKNPKDPAFEDQKVQFLTNVKGQVDSLAVTMEPRLKPIVFSKRAAARLSDAAFLKQYVGAYELAGKTVNIRLNGNALVLDTPGQGSVTLIPDQDDSFKVKEQSELSIRFIAADDPGGGDDPRHLGRCLHRQAEETVARVRSRPPQTFNKPRVTPCCCCDSASCLPRWHVRRPASHARLEHTRGWESFSQSRSTSVTVNTNHGQCS